MTNKAKSCIFHPFRQGTVAILHTTPADDREEHSEDAVLKTGYTSMWLQRWPMNDDPDNCDSVESAVLNYIEKETLDIPDHLEFQNLEDDLPEEERERIRKIWSQLMHYQHNLAYTSEALLAKWDSAPRFRDKVADRVIESYPRHINKKYRKSIKALISTKGNDQAEDANRPISISANRSRSSRLRIWQKQEKPMREALYKAHKNYVVCLRYYYEMLLQKSDTNNDQDTKYILPEDHPHRSEILLRLRYIRDVVDTTHQGLTVAKTGHHYQAKRRIRKTSGVPYLVHETEVTLAGLLDAVIINIEEAQLPKGAVDSALLILALTLHDLGEDTNLTLNDISTLLKRLLDKYDSSMEPVIESGFKQTNGAPLLSREEIKSKILDIGGKHLMNQLKQILRILSNNTELNAAEKRRALIGLPQRELINELAKAKAKELQEEMEEDDDPSTQRQRLEANLRETLKDKSYEELSIELANYQIYNTNVFPEEVVIKALNLDTPEPPKEKLLPHEVRKSLNITEQENAQAKTNQRLPATLQLFPDTDHYDNYKLSAFLIRLNAIATSMPRKQHALIVKLEDRANNLSTQDGMKPEKRLANLRATVTRLLPWCIYDHDNINYPLFNALPRCIDATIEEYKAFMEQYPDLTETCDHQYLDHLNTWTVEVMRYEVPARIKAVMENYKARKAA